MSPGWLGRRPALVVARRFKHSEYCVQRDRLTERHTFQPGARACLFKIQCPMNDSGIVDSSEQALSWRRGPQQRTKPRPTQAHASPTQGTTQATPNGPFWSHRMRNNTHIAPLPRKADFRTPPEPCPRGASRETCHYGWQDFAKPTQTHSLAGM